LGVEVQVKTEVEVQAKNEVRKSAGDDLDEIIQAVFAQQENVGASKIVEEDVEKMMENIFDWYAPDSDKSISHDEPLPDAEEDFDDIVDALTKLSNA